MNVGSINSLLLVYIGFGVFAVMVLLLVLLGNGPKKKN
jgi:hypothetical protein